MAQDKSSRGSVFGKRRREAPSTPPLPTPLAPGMGPVLAHARACSCVRITGTNHYTPTVYPSWMTDKPARRASIFVVAHAPAREREEWWRMFEAKLKR